MYLGMGSFLDFKFGVSLGRIVLVIGVGFGRVNIVESEDKREQITD